MTARGKHSRIYKLVILLLLLAYPFWTYYRPLPEIKPEHSVVTAEVPTQQAQLVWPTYGQSAILVRELGYINHQGVLTPKPIASVAKLITALCVLQVRPLTPGLSVPTINLSNNDLILYMQSINEDGSLLPISTGEQISEYDMLQAMLLPSANNIANSLAVWAFGSMDKYIAYANNFLKVNGLYNTVAGADASGLSPKTTSTATDLIKLGNLALKQPTIAGIVSKSSASLGTGQIVYNVNTLLGKSNINGIKTGNSDEAGGVFLSASRVAVDDKKYTLITSVQGAPTIEQALKDSLALVSSAQANFRKVQLIKAGDIVGHYRLPWGTSIPAIASKDLSETEWQGANVPVTIKLNPISTNSTGNTVVGTAQVKQQIPIILKSQPTKPNYWWRFTHPLP